MEKIKIQRAVDEKTLKEKGVFDWPVWTKEASEFPWTYDTGETCYFLEGEVTVIPENEAPVSIGKGDLVTFPRGMACVWKVHKNVKKHYRFE